MQQKLPYQWNNKELWRERESEKNKEQQIHIYIERERLKESYRNLN